MILHFLYTLLFIISLAGYISISHAASTASDSGESLISTQSDTPTYIQSSRGWVKGRLLVTPRAGLPPQQLEKLLKHHGAQSKHHVKELNFHIVELPGGVDEVNVMHELKKDFRLKDVELDLIFTSSLAVTDPSFSNSWALPKIQATTAWDIATGNGVVIAILDSGVDGNHPDLAANMVPGWNTFDGNSNTSDVYGHGTMVAGTAAAAANNSAGSTGVSWMSSIMPIRVTDLNGYGYASSISQGLYWAADHGAKVANLSFDGLSGSSTVKSAASYMRSKGGVVVAAAGNSGTLNNYPASDSLLVAAATNSSDVRPSWSSYGAYVDVSAPGVSIYTTLRGGGYGYVSGTSFSSPITAATVALMFSANNTLTPTDVDKLIQSTAVDLGDPSYDQYYGAGRVSASAAVAAALASISKDTQAPAVSIASPTGGKISGIVPINVSYSDNVGVTRIELRLNGQTIITDNQSPFAFSWDTTTVVDGDYNLTAHAFDAAGNQGNSASVTVTVSNNATTDSQAPTISITSPTGGSVSGTTSVNVSTSDNVSVTQVELYVNGVKVLTNTQSPFTFSWNTTNLTEGTYTLTTKAFDAAGNSGSSNTVSVTVSKDTTPPVITSFNLTDGMTVARKQMVNVSASDNQAVTQMVLIIDGVTVATSQSSSLSYAW
ncbi:MAG: S8 family serine peptidase, partial [Pseudomonadota bacterium]